MEKTHHTFCLVETFLGKDTATPGCPDAWIHQGYVDCHMQIRITDDMRFIAEDNTVTRRCDVCGELFDVETTADSVRIANAFDWTQVR